VHRLLGGKVRERVRVYANGWYSGERTPEGFAEKASEVVAKGYTALKFDPFGAGFYELERAEKRRVIALTEAVYDAVGPDVDVLVDMSAELTTDAAIRLGRRMEEFALFFFEEPVDPFDVGALKKVSEQVHIPIAVGERLYTRYGFRPVVESHAADILQPDIGNTGGIMEAKKIAAMAETYNMRVQPHTCSSPVATAAALQLDACIPNFVIQELYPYRIPEHFAIVDHAPELDVRDGVLPIPGRPGLGVDLIEERVRPFLWATCTL
jgi:galactonate dehydratase